MRASRSRQIRKFASAFPNAAAYRQFKKDWTNASPEGRKRMERQMSAISGRLKAQAL